MTKTEERSVVPQLTRLFWAMATLAGVGASLGLGLGTLILGRDLTEFVATNQLKMPVRLVLLRWFFVAMLTLPALFSAVAVLRVSDPHRLRTLERAASKVAPVTALGLLPMLLHEGLWKGRTQLFLVATLIATLLVWGSLRNLAPLGLRGDFRLMVQAIRARLPGRFGTVLPWVVLGAATAWVIAQGFSSPELLHARAPQGPTVVTLSSAVRQLGHGGFLVLPFVFVSALRAPSALNTFASLVLLAGAALPLYGWAKSRLGTGPALLVALFYLSFPPLLTAGANSSLPLGCAALFFFVAAEAWERRRYVVASIATLLMFGVHEQTAFWSLCLLVYLARKQPASQLFPLLVLAPLAYFAWVGGLLLPTFGIDPYGEGFRGLWSDKTPGMIPALATLFENPVYALTRFVDQRDFTFWLIMLVPFALLPLRGRLWLLWALPFSWFGVVALGRFPDASLSHFSVAHFVVMGFVASVTALESIKQNEQGKPRLWAALLTWLFAIVPCVYQLGCAWLPPL